MNDEFIINFTIYIVFLKFAIKMHDNIYWLICEKIKSCPRTGLTLSPPINSRRCTIVEMQIIYKFQ